jgi:hypothetical protein
MMNLIKVLAEIRMKNLFSEEKRNNEDKVVISINETTDIVIPEYKELIPLINEVKKYNYNINYRKMDDNWKNSRKANGLSNPDEVFEISYDSKVDNIIKLLDDSGFKCYEKPRMSKPTYAKFSCETCSDYKIDIYVNLIDKTINICKFNNSHNNILTNIEVESICESIMNEYTMSVANISPIVTNNTKYIDKDNTLLSKLNKIKEMAEVIESPSPQDSVFSPNIKVTPNPLDSSDNFKENNEDIIVDMETDPYNTKPNDFAELIQSNIKSYF